MRNFILATMLVTTVGAAQLAAHRVIGRAYPALATALIQSPTASPSDLPVAIFDTGLSVICIRVSNTSPADARITAIGLELPGALSGFSLVSPANGQLTLHENVGPIAGFPGVSLDLVLMPSVDPSTGLARPGLPPRTAPIPICISGPFPVATPIETLLNGVFVRFESAAGLIDVGVWERR